MLKIKTKKGILVGEINDYGDVTWIKETKVTAHNSKQESVPDNSKEDIVVTAE